MPGDVGHGGETRRHYLERFEIVIDEGKNATQLEAASADGAGTGEEVEDVVAGVGGCLDDAVDHAEGFLGGVAGFLGAVGGHDGVPPGVGGEFAAGGFFGTYQPGSHVGDALDGVDVEGVVLGVFGVPEDVIVLGRPFFTRTGAVVVCPDDLVEERLAAKDGVEENFTVVDLAVVDVEVEAAVGLEQAVRFGQAGLEKSQVVVEDVGVAA